MLQLKLLLTFYSEAACIRLLYMTYDHQMTTQPCNTNDNLRACGFFQMLNYFAYIFIFFQFFHEICFQLAIGTTKH